MLEPFKIFLDTSHRAAASVLTLEGVGAFVPSAVGALPSLETLPKFRTFSRPLTPVSSLQPNRTAVAVGTMKNFGNPQHQQHGEEQHQQTRDPHGNVSGGLAIRGRPFNHAGWLQTTDHQLVAMFKNTNRHRNAAGSTAVRFPRHTNPHSLGLSPKSSDNVSPRMQLDLNEGKAVEH